MEIRYSCCGEAGAEQVNVDHLIAQGLGKVSQQLAGADHDAQIESLVADDISKLRSGTQDGAEVSQVRAIPPK